MLSNEMTIVGNITRDPELRYTAGGTGVASFGMACNRRYMQNNEWKEEVSFFNITAWGELGENVAASLAKGNRVLVNGRMDQNKYTNREGIEVTTFQLTAEAVGAELRFATCEVSRTERTAAAKPQGADPIYDSADEPF